MHQTFYIDIDEEITSIVDRLRKAKSKEVVIVVPKRAILIQSIINLKLLKKEADSVRKNIIIVTQDKFGKMLVEKAGMVVEQKLDDIEGQELFETEDHQNDILGSDLDSGEINLEEIRGHNRLDNIGSDGYHQSEKPNIASRSDRYLDVDDLKGGEGEIITNRELVVDMGEDLKKQQASFQQITAKKGNYAPMDMIRNVEIFEEGVIEKNVTQPIKKDASKKSNNLFKQEEIHDFEDNSRKENLKMKKASSFFEQQKIKNIDEYKSINIGNNAWRYLLSISLFVIIVLAGAAAYVFLPKASVIIFAKNKIQTIDSQIDGRAGVDAIDLENEIIPAKIVSVSADLTEEYDTTGTKNSSGQKARGTITIYNEFSSSPQPLVATTRFESSDKKIFRLVSGVTVPGVEKIGSESKPGAIEAEVIADEPGDQYNIDSTSFTIPGFQSSGADKYAKIYAKSFDSMSGGGKNNQIVRAITEEDINSAKTKIAQKLRSQINQRLKDSAGEGFVILDDAVNIDDSSYALSKSQGDIADNFSTKVTMKASAVVFRSDDIKKVVANALAKKSSANMTISMDFINLEYGKADVNFNDETIVVRVHGTGKIIPNIDLEKIRRDILGRQEDDLKNYLSTYVDIDRAEVSFWPAFISGKIPNYARQVNVTIDSNENSH